MGVRARRLMVREQQPIKAYHKVTVNDHSLHPPLVLLPFPFPSRPPSSFPSLLAALPLPLSRTAFPFLPSANHCALPPPCTSPSPSCLPLPPPCPVLPPPSPSSPTAYLCPLPLLPPSSFPLPFPRPLCPSSASLCALPPTCASPSPSYLPPRVLSPLPSSAPFPLPSPSSPTAYLCPHDAVCG